MLASIPIITHLWNMDFQHWWNYYYWGRYLPTPKNVWYERGVWGNVFADIPLALVALGVGAWGFFWHKEIMRKTHEKLDKLAETHQGHTEHLKKILDALDPETDGGITDLHAKLDTIRDALDTHTPGGLTEIIDRLEKHDEPLHTGVSVLRDDVDKDEPIAA